MPGATRNTSASDRPAAGLRPAVACAILAAAVVLGFAVAGTVAYARGGLVELAAAAVAALVCLAAAMTALLLVARLRNSQFAIHGLMAGTLVRMLVPLSVALALKVQDGPLARAGVLGYILAFFLLTLVVESALAVRLVRSHEAAQAPAGASQAAGSPPPRAKGNSPPNGLPKVL